MGTFAMPALPSLPSVKSLINVSPPLVYPSPDAKKHSRSRATSISGSTAQLIQEQHAQASPSWNDRGRGRALKRYGEGDDTPTRRPIPHSTSLLASPKHDPIDARQWEPLPSRPVIDWRDDTTPHASPSRPPLGTHRRSHSAVPQRHQFPSNQPSAPMGRLTEFTRNSLASTSAISLPTLLEGGDGTTEEESSLMTEESSQTTLSPGGITPVSISSPRYSLSSLASSRSSSPSVKARPRNGSRSTTDGPQASSPISPVSLPSLMPPPLIPENGTPRQEHKRSFSSVPPPQAMRPPPVPLNIQARSRRDSESHAAPLSPSRPPFAHRHSAVNSTASVSDVAVLATWSFPNSPEKTSRPSLDSPTPSGPGQPSDRLKQRLRSLSTLDTSQRPTSTPPSIRPRTSADYRDSPVEPIIDAILSPPRIAKPGLARASTTVRPEPHRLPPHLTHRHSHSSPSDIVPSLPIGPSISGSYHPTYGSGLNPTSVSQVNLSPLRPPLIHPPARHARRPTTSRLRQPNPLCMPIAIPPQVVRNHSAQNLQNLNNVQITPASSPGSMISDLQSIISDRVSELDKSSEEADALSVQSISTDELVGSSDAGHELIDKGMAVEPERGVQRGFRLRSMASTPSLKPLGTQHGQTLRSNKSTLSLRTLGLGLKDNTKTESPARWSFFGSLVGLARRKNSISDLSTRSQADRRSRAQSMVDSYKAQGDPSARQRGMSIQSSYGFPNTHIADHYPDEEEEDEAYIDLDAI